MDKCQVWWADPGDVHAGHVKLLDPVEQARRERYLRAADRDRFTAGVAMTRIALARILGIDPRAVPIDRTCADCGRPHGAPRLADGDGPYLSISHSGDRVALAISPYGPLGVDVEAADRRFDPGLERHVLSPEELERGDHESGLLTYWTRKEAVVKSTGDGLRAAMTELTVSPADAPPALLSWGPRPEMVARISMRRLDPGPGYLGFLALIDQPDVEVVEERATRLLGSGSSDGDDSSRGDDRRDGSDGDDSSLSGDSRDGSDGDSGRGDSSDSDSADLRQA